MVSNKKLTNGVETKYRRVSRREKFQNEEKKFARQQGTAYQVEINVPPSTHTPPPTTNPLTPPTTPVIKDNKTISTSESVRDSRPSVLILKSPTETPLEITRPGS